MSIKDEIQHVKEELSGDEKILESAFKLERIYRKNKILIWGVVLVGVLGLGGNAAWNAYTASKLHTANDAFLLLQNDPTNTQAAATLQANNPKLYTLYALSQALTKHKADALATFASSKDPLVHDIAAYHAGVLKGHVTDAHYYHDLALIEETYLDLKSGKIEAAKSRLSLISETSPVAQIARLLKHATLK